VGRIFLTDPAILTGKQAVFYKTIYCADISKKCKRYSVYFKAADVYIYS